MTPGAADRTGVASAVVDAASVIADVFAGIAALSGLGSVGFAWRTVREARSTSSELQEANAAAAERFAAERRHQLLVQTQLIADLLGELAEIVAPRAIASTERVDRYQSVRRQLLAALEVERHLTGGLTAASEVQSVVNHTRFGTPVEVEAAQLAVVDALRSM